MDRRLPHRLMKAVDAAVETVGAVVGGQGIVDPVQVEGGPADAVGHPAHQGAEVFVLLLIVGQGVAPQHHIPVLYQKTAEDTPVGKDLGRVAACLRGPLFHFLAPGGDAERFSRPVCHGSTFLPVRAGLPFL